jgi:hypothetical protein
MHALQLYDVFVKTRRELTGDHVHLNKPVHLYTLTIHIYMCLHVWWIYLAFYFRDRIPLFSPKVRSMQGSFLVAGT